MAPHESTEAIVRRYRRNVYTLDLIVRYLPSAVEQHLDAMADTLAAPHGAVAASVAAHRAELEARGVDVLGVDMDAALGESPVKSALAAIVGPSGWLCSLAAIQSAETAIRALAIRVEVGDDVFVGHVVRVVGPSVRNLRDLAAGSGATAERVKSASGGLSGLADVDRLVIQRCQRRLKDLAPCGILGLFNRCADEPGLDDRRLAVFGLLGELEAALARRGVDL